MFGRLPTSAILGVRMHWAQSRVGKTFVSFAMCPPMLGSLSTRWTLYPCSSSSREAVMPAIPPPTTSTSLELSSLISSRGLSSKLLS